MFLNFVHIRLCQKEEEEKQNENKNKNIYNLTNRRKGMFTGVFILVFIEENYSEAGGCCTNCKLLERQHLIDVF